MTDSSTQLDARRRRLLYRATHRGTKENDIIVGRFVTANIAAFSASELAALELLLEWPDPELADVLGGKKAVPAEADTPLLRALMKSISRT